MSYSWGESAGGTLVLSLALLLKEKGLPLPKALVAFSPCVTQADQFPSYTENAAADYMLRTSVMEGKIKVVFGSRVNDLEYLRQPAISPLYGDFSDLKTGRWYEAGVSFALKNGLMNGVGGGKFDPDGSVTRGMLVTILYRVEKTPSVEGMKNPFTDVKSGAWYTDAIVWAADQGIVNGTSATTFAPDAFITREQIATILYRYAKAEKTEKDLSAYPDAGTVSGYAVDAMRWAVAEGLINGKDGRLAPQENATRAQIATILERYLSK